MRNWTPNEIKKALIDAGVTQAEIAREKKVSNVHVHRVIHGGQSDRIRRAIAAKIGRDVKEVWPEIYLAQALTA